MSTYEDLSPKEEFTYTCECWVAGEGVFSKTFHMDSRGGG